MEINDNNILEFNQITYQKIVGAFFRYHRENKSLTLVDFAKKVNMNKGFLSDLENGKRHFPYGSIEQLSNAMNVTFSDDITLYDEAISYLRNVFEDHFYQVSNEYSYISKLPFQNVKLLNSLGFFPMLIVNFYYSFYIEKNNKKALKIKHILDKNISCLKIEELAYYYCFISMYYKIKNNKIFSIKFLDKSIACSSKSPIVYAMSIFYLVDLHSSINRPLKAYKYLTEAENLMNKHHNFIRLFECEILRCNILTRLHLFEESESTLIKILNYSEKNLNNSNYFKIYRHLAWNSLLAEKYDDCIHYTRLARDNGDFLGGLCYFIPYSYYKKGEYEKALNVLNEEYVHADNTYKPFLFAIRARIRNKDSLFESHILKCYKILLSSQEYDGLSFTLNMMVEYYDEKHKSKMLINTFKDMQSLNKNSLTVENSLLLKTIKKKKR